MFTDGKPPSRSGARILVVRLGAMGDLIHTLPAAASLKHSHANAHLTWLVESRWRPLLEENPFVDRIVELRRGSAAGVMETDRKSTRLNSSHVALSRMPS